MLSRATIDVTHSIRHLCLTPHYEWIFTKSLGVTTDSATEFRSRAEQP
ncbi:CRISPR-associated DxTHG motif protein [Photobacterium damselae subsp. piscicida]|nr:CRISPR-associated DxTHG motif protein [Photobacterium damselae subsp. piscicida]TJZ91327.1 CRISPR-associated DxTHG motif protein [Photobacterium damselae subsp. piscicida]